MENNPSDSCLTGHRSSQRITTGPARRRRGGGASQDPMRRRPRRALTALAGVGAVAVVAAGATLAAATFGADETHDATGSAGTHRSDARSCVWVTQENGPVVPQELFLAAPSADAALVFEYCDAEWTGDMAWLESREQLPTSDDGLPNPWEAGNRAVERWLEGRTGHDPSGWRGP
jgi:hypothetical protein